MVDSQARGVPVNTYDTSSIAIIPFNQRLNRPFPSTYRPAELSDTEVLRIDSLLKDYAQKYNAGLARDVRSFFSINFETYQYKRQYVAVFNSEGEKEVWVNAFCNTFYSNWKSEILVVDDGGNCYFNLKINLTTNTCFELMVNGYA
jgi:hypothetical protein